MRLKSTASVPVTTKNAMTGFGSARSRPSTNSAAHADPAEDRLGDDRAADERADVERR